MLTAILSRTWWSSRKKGEGDSPATEEERAERRRGEQREEGSDEVRAESRGAESEGSERTASEGAEGGSEREAGRDSERRDQPREDRRGDRRRRDDSGRGDSRGGRRRFNDGPQRTARQAEVSESGDDEDEVETHLPEDPLAAAFDLGNVEEEEIRPRRREKAPAKARIESAKEFFTTELLYRFDILEPKEREKFAGTYRIEVKGNRGGIWTLNLGPELEIINRREDAETVLALQHRDFVALVNGDINPQLALLAQKVRFTGDVKRVVNFQNLLSPLSE